MKPGRLPALALFVIVLAPLFAWQSAAANPSSLEKEAVVSLYDTAVKISEYADNTDPMSNGKFSKETLDIKVSFYELALEALKDIADEPDYRASPKNLPFASTYNKAVLAKSRIESKIRELRELQKKYNEGKIHEDGEIDGSGLLWDDKYDNGKYSVRLIDAGKEDIAENKKGGGIFGSGISWWWILVLAVLAGIILSRRFSGKSKNGEEDKSFRGSIKEIGEGIADGLGRIIGRKNVNDKELRENKEVLELIEKIRQMINRILREIGEWAGKEAGVNLDEIKAKLNDLSIREIESHEINQWVEQYLSKHPYKDVIRGDLLELNSLITRLKSVLRGEVNKREEKIREIKKRVSEFERKFKEEEGGNYDIMFIKKNFPQLGEVLDYLDEKKEKGEVEMEVVDTIQGMINAVLKTGMNVEDLSKVLNYIQYGMIDKAEKLIKDLEKSNEELSKLMRELIAELELFAKDTYTPELFMIILESKNRAFSDEEELNEFLEYFRKKERFIVLDTKKDSKKKHRIEIEKIYVRGENRVAEIKVDEKPVMLRLVIEIKDKTHEKNVELLKSFIHIISNIERDGLDIATLRNLWLLLQEEEQDETQFEKVIGKEVTINKESLSRVSVESAYIEDDESEKWKIKSYDDKLKEIVFESFFMPLKIGGSDEEFKRSIKALLTLRHFRKSTEVTKEEFLWSLMVHHAYNKLEALNNTEKIVKRTRTAEVERNGKKEAIHSERKIKTKIIEANDELGTVTLAIDGFFMDVVLALNEKRYGEVTYKNSAKEAAPPGNAAEEEEEESKKITLNRLNSYLLDIIIIATNDYKHSKGIHLRVAMAIANALKIYPLADNIKAFKDGIKEKNLVIPKNLVEKYKSSGKGKDVVLKVEDYDFETNSLKFENMRRVLELSSRDALVNSLESVMVESEAVIEKKLEIEKVLLYLENAAKEGALSGDILKLVGKEIAVNSDISLEIEKAWVESEEGLGNVVRMKFRECDVEVIINPDERYRKENESILSVVAYSRKELTKGFISVSLFLRLYNIFKETRQDMKNLGRSIKGKKLKFKIRNEEKEFVIVDVDCEKGEMRLEEEKGEKSGLCRFHDRNLFMRNLLSLAGISTGVVTPESLVKFVSDVLKIETSNSEEVIKRMVGVTLTAREKGSHARIVNVKVENGKNVLISLDKLPSQVWVRVTLPALKLALQIISEAVEEGTDLSKLGDRIETFKSKQGLKDAWDFFLGKASENEIETYKDGGWKESFGGKALSESEVALFKALAKGEFVLEK